MTNDVYERLADALDSLPNGFPRTPSNVEIELLKRIFSPEEAWLSCQLGREIESVEAIAERVGLSAKEATARLMKMARRGLVRFDRQGRKRLFRLEPFIVGIYEYQLGDMDHQLAHLFEEYMANGGAVGIMKPQPALHRVVPAQSAVKSEWILPYDDVREILLAAKAFGLRDCICRLQQDHVGRECNFPVRMCLNFSSHERSPRPGDISQEEALALLERAEEIGLVHTVSNIAKGINYVCNCCGCCCGILRGITEWGIASSVAHANYYVVIDPEECSGCGACIERCQVCAISDQDGIAIVDRKSCIGCGLCVTGCPDGVPQLQRKVDEEIVHPPQDFGAWEYERLVNRGLLD